MRIWILGAMDPEMELIAELLEQAGETVVGATGGGRRVHPGNAYRATGIDAALEAPPTEVVLVECDIPGARDADGRMHWRAATAVAVHGEDAPWSPAAPGGEGCFDEGDAVIARRAVPVTVVDHHRPGDPGYGRPPAEFLRASSVGQVLGELARLGNIPPWPGGEVYGTAAMPVPGRYCRVNGRWAVQGRALRYVVPVDVVLAAAADHCLAAGYAGLCPGVDPGELARWRAETRAAFQGRSVDEVLADVEAAMAALDAAPTIVLARQAVDAHDAHCDGYCPAGDHSHEIEVVARDMRGAVVPELPEAATRMGEAYVAGPLRDRSGRSKITCSGPAPVILAFLDHWAPAQGLADCYGDPARGFAGGYLD